MFFQPSSETVSQKQFFFSSDPSQFIGSYEIIKVLLNCR